MRNLWFDIKAFLILRKEVLKNRNSPDWARHGLRHDWIYRIYTVINPGVADKGDDENMINMKAVDKVGPLNKYIASLGLAEIVSLSMEKIPDTESYLVVYYQIYKWFSPWRLISRLAILGLTIWGLKTYWEDIISFFPKTF